MRPGCWQVVILAIIVAFLYAIYRLAVRFLDRR